MKTLTTTLLAATAVITIGAVAVGCGRPWRHSPEKRADWAVKKISSRLDLNDAQRVKLEKIKAEALAMMKEESVNREKIGREALTLVKSDKIDAASVNKLFDEHEAAMRRLKPFFVEKVVEFHGMLTSEQREKLADLMEKHQRRWKDHE